jgi:hypothetical protein
MRAPCDDRESASNKLRIKAMPDVGSVPIKKTNDDIDVVVTAPTVSDGKYQAVVQDSQRQRAWSGEGGTASEATTRAVRGFLGDRHAPEYIRKPV